MKNEFLIFSLLALASFNLLGQKTNELISLRLGYSSTHIVFKEAVEPSINIFGIPFNTGNAYSGDGPEFGISKNLNDKISLDLSFSTFAGKDIRTKVNNNDNFYSLKGLQPSLNVNHLIRNSTKRFRINVGAGFQYLRAHLKQFESISSSRGQITNQLSDIKISEFQLSIKPGVQFGIIPNLFALFMVKISISSNGRYTDNPCLSLKYTFKKKQ